MGTKASPVGQITLNVKLGSTTIIQHTPTPATSQGNTKNFWVYADITCRTTGATGTVMGQAEFRYPTNFLTDGETATDTIDTTASQAVDVTVTWATADVSNTITGTNATVEVLN